MNTSDEVASLRTEAEDLRKSMTRTGALTLALLFLAAIGFGRAMQRINAAEVEMRLNEIRREADLGHDKPNLSAVLQAAYAKISKKASAASTFDERLKHLEAMNKKVDELEQIITPWFTMNVSIFGSDLSFDLRYWMFLLPPFLWITNGYLWISRAKLRVLHRVGRNRIQAVEPQQLTILDRLYFGYGQKRAAYADEPAGIGTFLYVVVLIAILARILASSVPLINLINDERWSALFLFSIVTIYVAIFPYIYARDIERQADLLIGNEGPPPVIARLSFIAARCRDRIVTILARVPRLSMSAGSAIVLTSLLMSLASDCHGHKHPGYTMLIPNSGVEWFSTQANDAAILLGPGRVVYVTAIVAAVATLLACLISLYVGHVIGARALTIISLFLVIFSIFDVGFAIPLSGFVVYIDLARILIMLIAFGLSWFYWLSKKERRRVAWRTRIRPVLAAVMAPGVVVAPVSLFMVAVQGFWGAYPFYIGSMLMAIGCAALPGGVISVENEIRTMPLAEPATALV